MFLIDLIITTFLLYLIFRFKSIIIKIFLFIPWYPFLILFLFKYQVPLSGILEYSKEEFNGKIINYGFYSYAIGLFLFFTILRRLRDKEFTYKSFNIPIVLKTFLIICLYLSAIPILNIHSGDASSFKSATLYLFFNMLLFMTYNGKKDFFWFAHLGIACILIINGERVDSILIVALLFLFRGKDIIFPYYTKKFLLIGGLSFFLILVSIGFLREGIALSKQDLIASFYAQRTVCDVVYIYLTGVKYYIEIGSVPEVLLNLVGGLIPGETMGTSSPYNYTVFLRKYMFNPGGGLFCTEGMLVIGALGPVVYFTVYGLIIKKLLLRKSRHAHIVFLLFLLMQCRTMWYGLIYIYKPLLMLLFILVIIKIRGNSTRPRIYKQLQ